MKKRCWKTTNIEYDSAEPTVQFIRRQEDGTLLVNARVDLDDLAEKLGVELPKGRYSNLAGFLLEKAGEVPPVDSSIEYKGLKFTVKQSSVRSIEEVKISTSLQIAPVDHRRFR